MRKISLLILSVLFSVFTYGQTILINPTGDGGFETGANFTANGWTTVNDATNTWNVGTVSVPSAGTNAAFVSNDLGVTNAYTNTAIQVSYFYKDITVPAGETKITLSFKWKNSGESGSWDRPFVYTAPTTSTPVANSMTVTGSTDVTGTTTYLVLQTTYQNATYMLPAGLAGTTFRLIFGWKNDGSGGVNPPASIDEISLTSQAPSPLHGIYTIDNTLPTSTPMVHDGTGNFASFTAAANYLNSDGISAAVTFRVLTGLTFTEDMPAINATGTAANTITFQKFGSGVNPILRPTGTAGTDAGITINGGDYFTFDGIDITEATGSAVEYGYYIKNASATDGAQNITIKNCKIILNRANTGSRGIYQNVATAATNATGANSNNKFQFVVVENSYNGIVCTGTAAFPDLSTEVSNCTIGANTPNDLGNGGSTLSALRLTSSQDAMVFNNTVRNATVTGGVTLYGIFMENVKGNSQVYNNKVYNISSTSTSTSALLYGIRLDVPATFQGAAYNNLIYGFSHAIATASATMVCRPLAVNITGTGSVALSYNTVNVGLNGSATVAAAYLNGGTIVLANNIFANYSVSGNATSKRYCIYKVAAATITSNYNDLFIATGTNNFVGYATADQATLANWQTASTQDANSLNVDPIFVGANDLHPSNPAVNNLGTPVLITLDIDGITRNATTPDMGAYEFTPASCLAPGALTATTITNNSATLGWTPNGPETLWNIQWGTSGFALGTGTIVSGLTATSYNLSGLTGSTAYSFYVQADCGGSTSTWAGPFAFTTKCDPLGIPYNEGFEGLPVVGTNLLPSCWAYSNITSTNYSCVGTCNTNTAHTGTIFIGGSWSFDVWNFTPGFQLTAGTSYDFSYWFKCADATVGYNVSLFYGSSQNVAAMTNSLNAETGLNIATWTQRTFTFTPSASGVYYFGLHNVCPTTAPNGIAFDDFKLDLTPSCVVPTALNATAVTSTTATINWTASVSLPANGYQYEVRTSGAAGSGATGLVTSGTTTAGIVTANISGLTANTTYSFYVLSDCGGTLSSWTSAATFFTGYCTPAPTSVDGSGITNVTCGTINNTTIAEPGNYGDYSAMIANIAQSTTATVNITYSTGYTYDTKIWIDWNDDLDFLDLGEEVYTGTSLATNPTTLVATFLVPLTAPLGNHRMRIGGQDTGPCVPCYASSYGSYEDYTVNVTAPPACIAPTALAATGITNNSATLGWVAGGTETLWNVEWSTSGFTQGTGTMVTGVTANSYNLTTLTANAAYSFYVQANCGGSTSTWVGPFSFTTLCDAANIPYTENFDAAIVPALASCMSVSNDNTDAYLWTTGTGYANSAPNSMVLNYNTDATTPMNDWFYTPGLNLQTGKTYKVGLSYRARSATYPEKLEVKWGTAPNAAAMTSSQVFDNASIANTTYSNGNGTFTVPANGVYYVGFHGYSIADTWALYVDDISVTEASTANSILTFDVPTQTSSTIGVNTVNILMPCATNVTALIPAITVSAGATISPATSVAQDFTSPVTYTVTAEDGTTTSTWTVSVISHPLPTIALTSPSAVTFCNGGNTDITLALTGTGPWTWVGDDGSGPATFNAATSPFTTNVAPTVSTTYSIISVTDANGCTNTSTDAVVVTVNPASVAGTATPTLTALCSGNGTSIALAGNTGTIQWQSSPDGTTWSDIIGETNATLTTGNLISTTHYQAIVTSGVCSSTTSNVVDITVNPLPTIALTSASAVSICNGGNTDITLALTGTGPWTWVGDDGSGPATFNETSSPVTSNVAPTSTTTYSIISVTDATGCSSTSTDAVVVTVNTPATIVITENTGVLTSDATTGNQWYDANGIIVGETGTTFTPTTDGNYYVIVTDINGCTSTSNTISFVLSSSNIGLSSSLNIYPNPAKDKVFVEVSNSNNSRMSIELMSLDGRVLYENYSEVSGKLTISINLNEYASGIYMIKAVSENNTLIQKLVIE